MFTIQRRALVGAIISLAALGHAASASTLPAPKGDVILSIQGKISVTNGTEAAAFDMAMLEAMPKVTITTSTPWTEGTTTFEGVALKDILSAAGAQGATLDAVALNDYAAPLPASDADTAGAIVAYKVNGQYMSVRDKGPLWIIYPFDQMPELKTETIYSRCVWQLQKINVKD